MRLGLIGTPDPSMRTMPFDHALPAPGYDLSLVSHLHDHLIWMRLQGRAEDTLAARRRTCVRLAEHYGIDPIRLSREQLYGWQVHLLRTSKTLVRHQTALIRPYYAWVQDMGYRPDNPARLLALPRARRGVPRPIAEPRLYDVIAAAAARRPRLLPWLLLAGWSGLRAAEIAGLRVDDFTVDHRGQVMVRVLGKGDAERVVPVDAWCWPTIQAALAPSGAAWRRQRGFGHVTAQHVSQYCNNFLRQMGYPDTLHSLRHRVATLAYEQTGDIRLVQDLLGHAHMSTTAIYTRVSPGRIATALAQLPHPTLPSPAAAARHLHVVDDAHGGTA